MYVSLDAISSSNLGHLVLFGLLVAVALLLSLQPEHCDCCHTGRSERVKRQAEIDEKIRRQRAYWPHLRGNHEDCRPGDPGHRE